MTSIDEIVRELTGLLEALPQDGVMRVSIPTTKAAALLSALARSRRIEEALRDLERCARETGILYKYEALERSCVRVSQLLNDCAALEDNPNGWGENRSSLPAAAPDERCTAGWLTIDSAPKQRVILLWAITGTDPPNWKMATGFWCPGYGDDPGVWQWDGHRLKSYDVQPTHWMPLPSAPGERSDISFDRAMELGALVLELHERGLDLVNIKDKADEWVRNRDDYRSVCYTVAPILAVKLRDALGDLQAVADVDGQCQVRGPSSAEPVPSSPSQAAVLGLVEALEMSSGRWADLATLIERDGPYGNAGFCRATAERCDEALSRYRATPKDQ